MPTPHNNPIVSKTFSSLDINSLNFNLNDNNNNIRINSNMNKSYSIDIISPLRETIETPNY